MRYVFSLIMFTLVASAAQAADAPQAKLVEVSKDSGTFFVGASAKDAFEIENTGTVAFRIVEVKTSCHCTTAVMDKGEIAPGERGRVSYEMTGTAPGRRTINMRVTTDPPMETPPIFTATATFNPYIEIDMKDIAIEVSQGETIDRRIPLKIAEEAGDDLKILGVVSRGRGFEVSLDSADAESPALLVKTNEPLPVGKRTVRASIEYDLNGKASQDVILSVTTLGLVQITPSPIKANFERDDQKEATATVTLKHNKNEPFLVTKVVARGCQIKEVALPVKPAAEHTLEITFIRNPQQRISRGYLTFDLDSGIGSLNAYALLGRSPGALPPVVTR